MFRKTVAFGHSGQILPFPVVEYGQNCQKAHLHAKIDRLRGFPRDSRRTPYGALAQILGRHFTTYGRPCLML